MQQYKANCWPTDTQELLLKAALLENGLAISAWEEWKSTVNLDSIDPGSFRLLPILYRHMYTLGISDTLMGKLKGIYRQTWFQNRLRLNDLKQLLSLFQKAAVPTMVLKGMALIQSYYKELGLRPMNDLDILVPTSRAGDAASLVRETGWTPVSERAEMHIAVLQGTHFHNAKKSGLDLHWHVLPECCDQDADDDFWTASQPTTIEGTPTRTLCPTDQLMHVCMHGMRWDPVPPIRWIADAMVILRRSQGVLDWGRLLEQASQRELSLPLIEAIEYLYETFQAPIPEFILQALKKTRVSKRQILELSAKTADRSKSIVAYLRLYWYAHLRLSSRKGSIRTLMTFPGYLQRVWAEKSSWFVPVRVVQKILNKISDNSTNIHLTPRLKRGNP